MRILLVHYNPAAPGRAGGAESALRDQRLALERLGHTVEWAFTKPQLAFDRFRPDVVHFHTIHVELGLGVLEWARREKIPHCLSLHDYWPFCKARMLLRKADESCPAVTGVCDSSCSAGRADKSVLEAVSGTPTVVFNPYSAEIYRRHGVRVDVIIPHGIDTDFFAPDYAKRGEVKIITSSAWPSYPTKGLHILKRALYEIDAKGGLVTGVPRERVRDELQKASIFVFPSCYEETYGLCLTEAMACGCACVASDVCGPRSQIEHGVTGFLFPNRDSHALGVYLRQLLDDGALRERIGQAARDWAASHANLNRLGRDYEAFYGRLTAERG